MTTGSDGGGDPAAATSTVLVIGGPTASGKSGLGLLCAEKWNGVVINADSMQVYDGLKTLTAFPSEDDMSRAPHRLYGVLQPHQGCSAARWRDMALAEIAKAHDAGRLPVVLGGTGFYINALLKGLSPVPKVPTEIREQATAKCAEMGNAAFHAALRERDPVMADRLDPGNTQRLIRAWEVLDATGKSLADWQAAPREGPPEHLEFFTVALMPPRDVLYEKCDRRFENMLDDGDALAEVETLAARIEAGEVGEDALLTRALGFAELRAFLNGELAREDAVARAQQMTRNYAKRQRTWFKNQMDADLVLEETEQTARMARLAETFSPA